jgi:hypothetical protein
MKGCNFARAEMITTASMSWEMIRITAALAAGFAVIIPSTVRLRMNVRMANVNMNVHPIQLTVPRPL